MFFFFYISVGNKILGKYIVFLLKKIVPVYICRVCIIFKPPNITVAHVTHYILLLLLLLAICCTTYYDKTSRLRRN